MSIELVIQKPVHSEEVREKFRVKVTYEHGDADFYDDQSITLEPEAAKKFLTAILFMDSSEFSELYDRRAQYKLLEAFLPNHGFSLTDAMRFIDSWLLHDKTNEGNSYAKIGSVEVFWYDANGALYDVDVQVDGKSV